MKVEKERLENFCKEVKKALGCSEKFSNDWKTIATLIRGAGRKVFDILSGHRIDKENQVLECRVALTLLATLLIYQYWPYFVDIADTLFVDINLGITSFLGQKPKNKNGFKVNTFFLETTTFLR